MEIKVDPEAPVERIQLDEGSWVDVVRNYVTNSEQLYESLHGGVAWQSSRLFRYDHWVEERRLGSMWRPGTPLPHPALAEVHRTLQWSYKVEFRGFGLIHYRDGGDGQGFHRDTDMKYLDNTRIAILTLGARRPWLLRPWKSKFDSSENRGATHDIQPGCGDLLVMGGRCQADWQHSVPYLKSRRVEPRISLQWRYTDRSGKPFVGGSSRAPLTYNR